MKKIFLIAAIFFLLPAFVFGQETNKKKVIYFYAETCTHCKLVNDYFQSNNIYDKYDIQKIEASDSKNIEYLNKFFDAFNVPAEKRGYPVIFFADKMISGDQPIIDNFTIEIDRADASQFPTPKSIASITNNNIAPVDQRENSIGSMKLALLISAALADAMNPCALAVLILLLSTVVAAKGRNSALLSGLSFSLAVFISYFLMGLGAYRAITAFSLPRYMSLGVGIFAILVGLANLKDFFWYGKYFIMEVPLSWRPKMQEILRKVSNPIGAFGAGFVVSLFLVPCASGPYLSILGLLATKVDSARTMSLLFLYNLVFVLPMIIITFAMYFGSRMGRIEQWRKDNLKLLHLITGAVMLFVGGYLIYTWI